MRSKTLLNPRKSGSKAVKSGAAALVGVDGVVKQRLGRLIGNKTMIHCQHILPRPVEKRHLPPAVGAGDPQRSGMAKVIFACTKANPAAVRLSVSPAQKSPAGSAHSKGETPVADKGISAVAVNGQQTVLASQVNHMEIPAKTPVRLSAVSRRLAS